jgi:signal transduction histidine kinase
MDNNQENRRDQLSTIGELAAVLAHEIKNPMNSIMINLEVLKSCLQDLSHLEAEEPVHQRCLKYLSVIDGEMRRLNKVIAGFLDVASPAESTRAPLNINFVIQNVSEFMALELSQRNIELKLDLDDSIPRFIGNADQIKQALLNLLLNSMQAMNKPDGLIQISTSCDKKMIRVTIEDNGMGIADSIVSQVFSPYFTTKEKGSGLGLAIVRRIVRDHGGFVELQSKEKTGTIFSLFFPKTGGSNEKP